LLILELVEELKLADLWKFSERERERERERSLTQEDVINGKRQLKTVLSGK
jgi:hypothetical protein